MGNFGQKLEVVRVLYRAGIFKPMRPDKTVRIAKLAKAWGRSPAMGIVAGAIKQPDAVAVIDDEGLATFDEVNRHSNALATLGRGSWLDWLCSRLLTGRFSQCGRASQ